MMQDVANGDGGSSGCYRNHQWLQNVHATGYQRTDIHQHFRNQPTS